MKEQFTLMRAHIRYTFTDLFPLQRKFKIQYNIVVNYKLIF